jgi:hypothetical protein
MAVYLLLISICCSLYSGYGVYLVHKNTWLAKWDNYQVPGNVGDLFQVSSIIRICNNNNNNNNK